jgi:hypothetical protein
VRAPADPYPRHVALTTGVPKDDQKVARVTVVVPQIPWVTHLSKSDVPEVSKIIVGWG